MDHGSESSIHRAHEEALEWRFQKHLEIHNIKPIIGRVAPPHKTET